MRDSEGKNAEKAKELSAVENISVVELDVTSEESVNSAVKQIIDAEGKIDVVVNNAGIVNSGLTETVSIEQSKEVFEVNTFGPLRVNRAVLPHMRKAKAGLIIQISSTVGRLVFPFIGAYIGSKFAVEALAESYSMELAPLGIDSVIIEPGAYPTEIFSKMLMADDTARAEEYGEMAQAPTKMFEGMSKMLSSDNAPNPQVVADAVKKLVDTPAGSRPIRTVADVMTGTIVEELNKAQDKAQAEMNKAMGM